MKEVIIDNTALNYLAELEEAMVQSRGRNAQEIINSLFQIIPTIHVPIAVKNEFASDENLTLRKDRLRNMIELQQSGFRHCARFDPIVFDHLRTWRDKGIDAGEAEAIAQSRGIGVRFFVTDDINCVKAVTSVRPELLCLDTLVLLAALDLNDYLHDRQETLRLFFTKVRPARERSISSMLRKAYKLAGSLYDFSLTKEELGMKTSAKAIFQQIP